MDFLEYSDVSAEIKGCMMPGRLKITDQNIVFKNSKTGKVEQIQAGELDNVTFLKLTNSTGLRIFLKNGNFYRFSGFKESDKDKISKYFQSNYKIGVQDKDMSCKGWNWGTARFEGAAMSFDVGHQTAFEIPLNYVSQCTAGKNEITMEFHQNDDAPVSLMEMRLFIPSNEMVGDIDPIEAFQKQVMKKASVINISGDAIAIFREIHCVTPRGRYDIKIFNTFFQLHGKTFDYKIPMSTVLRLFVLPHRDGRQMFFVMSLDPPIKQGQTRYHYLVLLFRPEEETSIELPFSEEELKDKYDSKLEKELSGPTYEVLGKIMNAIINRKLTGCGKFVGHSGTPAVGCSYKAAAGFLYPLERGFIYIHKPPIHIRFDEIASVNFARSGGSTRSFDFEIELKSGTTHTFSSIEKEEYGKLYDFSVSKKLHVKNRSKNDKTNYKDDFGDSDNEGAPDAYLQRVKAEGQERDEDDDDESEESTDEDFNPNEVTSDVAEEFDSNPSSSSSEAESEGSGGEKKKSKKAKKQKKEKKTKTVSEKPRKKSNKKTKDANQPKRPLTAFMMWMNGNRDKIKAEFPSLKITEIAKKGGELWNSLKDKSEWERKAAKAKEDYKVAMEEYVKSGGGGDAKTDKKKSPKQSKASKPSKSPVKPSTKSKEYISDDSSTDDDKPKKKDSESDSDEAPKKKKPKSSPASKKKEESEAEATSDSDDSDKKSSSKKKSKSSSSESADSDDDDD